MKNTGELVPEDCGLGLVYEAHQKIVSSKKTSTDTVSVQN